MRRASDPIELRVRDAARGDLLDAGSPRAGPGGAAEESPSGPELASGSSLLRDTFSRIAAIASSVLLGGIAAFVTARWLGPSGQGFASTLGFMSSIAAMALSLGLGDSAVTLVAWGRRPLREAMANTLGWSLASSALGALPFFAIATLILGPDDLPTRLTVAIVSLTVVPAVLALMGTHLLRVLGNLVASSGALFATSLATTASIVLFVAVLHLGLPGAGAATTCGALCGLAVSLHRVGRTTPIPLPRWEFSYLREAAPYGLKVQSSNMLWLAWGRVDLLLVYALLGAAAAGRYSIALTLGAMAGMPAYALTFTAFPRLARAAPEARAALIARLVRLATVVTFAVFLLLAAVLPVAIPLALGDRFEPAVVPAIMLSAGAMPSAAQWLLARGFAAAGEPNLTLVSLTLNVVVMCGLDLVLIPLFGLAGAAAASVLAPAAGLAPCLRRFARDDSLRDLAPRWRESVQLAGRSLRSLPPLRHRAAP
jgi:O-antigen/teichoic acid export membrane protein